MFDTMPNKNNYGLFNNNKGISSFDLEQQQPTMK